MDTIFQDILGNQWIEWPGRFEHNYSAVPDKCPGLIAFEKKISIQDSLLEPTRLLKHVFAVLKLENISNKRVGHLYFCKISVQDGLIKAYPYIRKWRVVKYIYFFTQNLNF